MTKKSNSKKKSQTTQTTHHANLKEKIKKIEKINNYFEKDDIDIEVAIEKYENGMKLVSEIKEILNKFELKIEEINEKYS